MCKVGTTNHGNDVVHKKRLIVISYDDVTQMPDMVRVEGYHVYPDGHKSEGQAHTYHFNPGLGDRSIRDVEGLRTDGATSRASFIAGLWQAWEQADTASDPAQPRRA